MINFRPLCHQIFTFCVRLLHPSWHFYASVVGVILGVVNGLVLHCNLDLSPVWLLAAVLLLFLSLFLQRTFLLAFACAAGFLCGFYRVQLDLLDQSRLAPQVGHSITISGHIRDEPEQSNGLTVLHLDELRIDDQELRGVLYVQLSTRAELERSDYVTVTGKLSAGFGTYIGSLYRPELIEFQKPDPPDYFMRLKRWFSERVRDYVASPAIDLGLGYLMGQKSGLSSEFAETLQLVGMTHVVVASGAHLGILVSAAKKIFGKFSKFAGTLFAFLMLGGFVMIVGLTPSMTRAALVTSLSLIAAYFGRKFTPWRLLLFVAAITLLINPLYLGHLGWQLSFASFAGILILAPLLSSLLYGGKRPPWLASMFIASISTSLICAPILIYSFGSLSFLALLANLVILPTLPYAMFLVFLTGLTSFLPLVASIFGQLATWLLELHIALINALSTQQSFILKLPSGQVGIFWLYLPTILLIICYNIVKFRRRIYHDYLFRS